SEAARPASVMVVPTPTPPFTQCPPVGVDTSCAVLIVINPDNTVTILTDPSQGPFDGDDDSLVGVQNNGTVTLTSLNLSSTTKDAFGFDGDGLCTVSPGPPGCPLPGATGYEGPNITFSNISAIKHSGTVNFVGGLLPGHSAYFALEEELS